MKKNFTNLRISGLLLLACLLPAAASAQDNDFWQKVRFGGSFGLAFGSGYTDVTLAPGALYEVNKYFGLGLGLQGTYVNQRDFYSAFMYGGSVITVFNPIPEIQLSAEVEQLRVNLDYDDDYFYNLMDGGNSSPDKNFWNTALFVGAGYRMENVTIGLRYNVLFDEDDLVYSDAFMPFVRLYF